MLVNLWWLKTFYVSFSQNILASLCRLCVWPESPSISYMRICFHFIFLVHVTMSFSFLNQNKCNCKYLQCTKAKVLWQYFYLFWFLENCMYLQLKWFKFILYIHWKKYWKELLEIFFRYFKVPRDSSIVGCEYTIQFYAISLLKEDTKWSSKKVKVFYPISQ